MTITQTIDTASMLQAYRQIHANKKEGDFDIALDSLEPSAENDSLQALQNEITQMKAAWLVASSLTTTTAPDGSMTFGDSALWDFFDYKQAGFRDSSAVLNTKLGVLNFDEIMQRKQELFNQNPRYADAVDYRYAMER